MTLVTSSYSDLCDLAFRERAWADSGSPPLPSPSPSPVCGWTKSRHRTEITRFQTSAANYRLSPWWLERRLDFDFLARCGSRARSGFRLRVRHVRVSLFKLLYFPIDFTPRITPIAIRTVQLQQSRAFTHSSHHGALKAQAAAASGSDPGSCLSGHILAALPRCWRLMDTCGAMFSIWSKRTI